MGLGIFGAVESQLKKVKEQFEKNPSQYPAEIAQLGSLLTGVGEITTQLKLLESNDFTADTARKLREKITSFSSLLNTELQGISSQQSPNKKVYATLRAIKDPVDMMAGKDYLEKLTNKDAVIKSFYDFSFINRQFGKVEIKSGNNATNEIDNGSNAEIRIDSSNQNGSNAEIRIDSSNQNGNNAEIEIRTENNVTNEINIGNNEQNEINIVNNAEHNEIGSISYGTDISRAIADYKEGCETYKNNLHSAMVGIAKDDKYPAEVFTEKMNFLNALIQDSGSQKRPFDKLRDTYILLNNFGKTKEDRQVDSTGEEVPFDLDDRNILSYRFFNHALGLAADKTFITGLVKQTGLPVEICEQLNDLVMRLLPYKNGPAVTKVIDKKTGKTEETVDPMDRIVLGCDDALRNKFNRTAVVIQMLSSSCKLMQQEGMDAPGQPFHAVYKKLKDFNNKIISSLKNEPNAAAPTEKDLREVLTEIGKCFKNLPDYQIYKEDGAPTKVDSIVSVLLDVSNVIPELKNETDAIHKIYGKKALKLRNDFVKKATATSASTDEKKLSIDTILGKSCQLYYDGFLSEKDYYMAFYNKMAADPAYNAHVMTKLEKELNEWVEKEKGGYEHRPGFAVLTSLNEAFHQAGSSVTEGKRPEKECRIPFYKMYMMAKFIQQEQAGKTMDAGQIAALQKRVGALSEAGNFEGLDNITVNEFSNAVKKDDFLDLVFLSEERRVKENKVNDEQHLARWDDCTSLNIFWKSINKFVISALTESSRGLLKNSGVYEAVSTAITKIKDLDAFGIGTSLQDYQELITACNKYKETHPAPSSQTGKLRLECVNFLIDNLQPVLAKTEVVPKAQQEIQGPALQNSELAPQNQESVPQAPQPAQKVLKLKMFGNLNERFNILSEKVLPGGRGNPDNKWYFDVADSLSQVSDAIENQENLSADHAKTAFQNLKTASEAMLGRRRDGVPKEMQPLYTALLAIQKPLDFFTEKLTQGTALTQALKDPGWMNGMFRRPDAVKEREDYKPGNFNIKGKSLKDVMDEYKAEQPKILQIYNDYVKKISGDEVDPDGMLKEKLALMQDYIDCHNDPERDNFAGRIEHSYKTVRHYFENQSMRGLVNNEYNKSPIFFDATLANKIEPVTLSGNLGKMKTLSDDARKLLKQEFGQLVMKRKSMGFSDELVERLGEYTHRYRRIPDLHEEIKELSDYDLLDMGDQEFVSLLENMTTLTQGMEAYILGGNGARIPLGPYDPFKKEEFVQENGKDLIIAPHAPTRDEMRNLAMKAAYYMDGKSLFLDNGKINNNTKTAFSLLLQVIHTEPELSDELKLFEDERTEKFKLDYLQCFDRLKVLAPDDPIIRTTERTSSALCKDILGRSFQMNAAYIRMARDPEYNERMLNEAITTMQELINNVDTKSAGGCKSTLFEPIIDFTFDEYISREQQLKDVFTTYLIGKQFQNEWKKMNTLNDPKLSGADRVKNAINPDIRKLMTNGEIDKSFISTMDSMVKDIQNTGLFKQIEEKGLATMKRVAESADLTKAVMETFQKPKLNFLKGVSDNIHEAMTQVSRNNSQSYQTMSEAYQNIFAKDAYPGSAKPEDYQKLYDACKEYANSHDSKPFTDNGKRRMESAMGLMFRVDRELAKNDPEFARKYQNDHAMNMARSKQYRDAAARYEKDQIREILSKNSNAYKNKFKALPADAQKKLKEHFGMLTIAQGFDNVLENVSGHEITGKFTDPKVQEKLKVCFNAMKANRTSSMDSFNADPDCKLNQIVPREAAAKKGNAL